MPERGEGRTHYWINWEEWTPHEAARHFKDDLGPEVFGLSRLSKDREKLEFRNNHTGWIIRVDVHGRYFTIHRPYSPVGANRNEGDDVQLKSGDEPYVAKDGRTAHLRGRGSDAPSARIPDEKVMADMHFRIPSSWKMPLHWRDLINE
jgi:hypothetical protein